MFIYSQTVPQEKYSLGKIHFGKNTVWEKYISGKIQFGRNTFREKYSLRKFISGKIQFRENTVCLSSGKLCIRIERSWKLNQQLLSHKAPHSSLIILMFLPLNTNIQSFIFQRGSFSYGKKVMKFL